MRGAAPARGIRPLRGGGGGDWVGSQRGGARVSESPAFSPRSPSSRE